VPAFPHVFSGGWGWSLGVWGCAEEGGRLLRGPMRWAMRPAMRPLRKARHSAVTAKKSMRIQHFVFLKLGRSVGIQI